MSDVFIETGFTFIGIACLLAPFAIKLSNRKFKREAVAVNLRVVAVHTRFINDGDGLSPPHYRPEFEITSGQYEGKRHIAGGTSMNPHNIGDTIPGFYHPSKGEIESLATQANNRTFGWLAFFMGPIMLSIAAFLHFV